MEDLIIKGSRETFFIPEVNFNANTGECSIEGESYLEDAFTFYQKLTKWIEDYHSANSTPINIAFKLSYFNTSSSRAILEFLRSLKAMIDNGNQVNVSWYYPMPDDDDMLLEAEDFIDESELEMELVPFDAED